MIPPQVDADSGAFTGTIGLISHAVLVLKMVTPNGGPVCSHKVQWDIATKHITNLVREFLTSKSINSVK